MVRKIIAELLGDKETKPNKFTIAMGELIKSARIETGLSQEELAELIYRRRATVSDFESGKHEPDATSLALIAAALNKPINYFYPNYIKREFAAEDLTTEEQEMLIYFRQIWDEKLKEVAIKQIKIIAEFDPVETLLGAIDFAEENYRREEAVKKIINKRRKT